MRLSELEAVVESLLFIAGDAVPLASIAQTIELDKATARAIVLSLADKYEEEKRGRGRPKKVVKKGRGRPRKEEVVEVEDKKEDVIIEDEIKVEEVVVKEESKKEKEVVEEVKEEIKKSKKEVKEAKEIIKEVKEEEIIEEEDRECEICKCYVRLSYITEDSICFECNEIKQDVVVECGVCANRFEQSEIDEHGMCSKCRTEFKQCELCKYYALDEEENFNDEGICIVCLNPSLLEE